MPSSESRSTWTSYTVTVWALFGIGLMSFIARLTIRLKVKGHLAVDDLLVGLGLVTLLASAIIWQIGKSEIFELQDVALGRPKPPHFQETQNTVAKYFWAEAYLFFTGLWAIKGSFLAYYDSLTRRLTWYRRAWWAIIVFTILTYIGSLFAYGFLNGLQFRQNLRNRAINYQFSADFVTDVFITTLPLTLALKSKIPFRQKIVLSGIFSLNLVITTFSLIRYLLCGPPAGTALPTWIGIWSSIEHSVSVIIACLASLRTLFIDNKRKSQRSSEHHRRDTLTGGSGKKPKFLSSLSRSQEAGSMDLELLDRTPVKEGTLQTTLEANDTPGLAVTSDDGAMPTKRSVIEASPATPILLLGQARSGSFR